jgi:tetratricopeptide (TPR) repeat protein
VRVALIALAAVAAVAGAARATPSVELANARAEFRAGHFEKAQPLFNDLLYPPPPKLASTDELAEAYTNLGVCRAEGGDLDGAKREFEKALQIEPNHQIDETVVTDKSVVRLFDDTKSDIKIRDERIAAQNAKLEYEKQLALLRANTKLYEAHTFYLNFLPFGVGQFQNDQPAKGTLFLTGEAVTGGLTFGLWFFLVNKYGINCVNCVARSDATTVLFMQQTEIVSGLMFIGLYVWGAIDAYRNYTPTKSVKVDDDFLKREILDKQHRKQPKTSLLDRLRFSPMVTPNGAGLGLSWEH